MKISINNYKGIERKEPKELGISPKNNLNTKKNMI